MYLYSTRLVFGAHDLPTGLNWLFPLRCIHQSTCISLSHKTVNDFDTISESDSENSVILELLVQPGEHTCT